MVQEGQGAAAALAERETRWGRSWGGKFTASKAEALRQNETEKL
jgi:hypothetical protein